MKLIWALTLKNMKAARRRTLVTIFGVIISVAMITAVGTAQTSFTDVGIRSTEAATGSWHYSLPGLSAEQAKQAAQAFPQAQTAALYFSAFVSPEDMPVGGIPNCLYALSPGFEDVMKLTLTEGTWPQNSAELLLPSYLMEALHKQIGDSITLTELSCTASDGTVIRNPAQLTTRDGKLLDTLSILENRVYRISGCYSDAALMNIAPINYSPFYTRLDGSAYAGTAQLYYHVETPSDATTEKAAQLGERFGAGYEINSSLLAFYGVSRRMGIFEALGMLAAVVYGIIFIGSVSLIYNAFSISLTERSRQFGMLSSVGATRRQIRASVFMEAAFIGVIAIPLGLFFGVLGIDVTLRLLSGPLTSLFGSRGLGDGFYAVVTTGSLIFAAVLSALTLFFSALFPALRAGRFSAIEALNASKDLKLRPRDVKTSKLTRLLFGFDGELALKNIKRNRNRYRATVLSLILCVVLFLTASGFLYYMQKVTDNMLPEGLNRYNLSVYVTGDEAPPSDLQLQKAEELAGAPLLMQISSPVGMSQSFQAVRSLGDSAETAATASVRVIGVPDAVYREIVQNPSENSAVFYNNVWVYDPDKGQHREEEALPVKTGDMLTLSYMEDALSFQLDSVTTQLPASLPKDYADPSLALLILPQSGLLSMSGQFSDVVISHTLYYQSPDPAAAKRAFDEVDFGGTGWWYANDLEASTLPQRQMSLIFSVFLYGFIALISLVCTANIFNTVSTGVALRKREFAMLQSCGMTPKSFSRMIRFENLFYGVKALLWGWPLGTLALFFEYRLLGTGLQVRFGLPLWGYLGSAIGVFLIVGLGMLYAGKKVRRGNIIDALKTETL